MKILISICLVSLLLGTPALAQEKVDSLTLEKALELALSAHPELETARQEILVARGHRTQAGLMPNPELVLGTEAGNPGEGIFSEGDFITGIKLELPVFGRLTKAKRVEEKEIALKEQQQIIAVLEIENRVKASFAIALYWDNSLVLLEQLVKDSLNEVEISRARLEEGDIIPADLAQREMELVAAQAELAEIRSLRTAAVAHLTEAIGDPELQLTSLSGKLIAESKVPELNDLLLKIDNNPYLQEADKKSDIAQANLDLRRTSRFPDLEVELMHRRLNETKESRYDIGLSFSLPVFDRNQGEIAAAEAMFRVSQASRIVRRNALVARLRTAHSNLTRANKTLELLTASFLPQAEKAYQAAAANFEEGEISLADFLPHRREYLRTKLTLLLAQRDLLLAWTEIYPFTR